MLILLKSVSIIDWKEKNVKLAGAAEIYTERLAEAVWRQSYPALNNTSAVKSKHIGHDNNEKSIPGYIRWFFESVPIYKYLHEKTEKTRLGKEADPAYRSYLEGQEFYKEHEYLFIYGLEESQQKENIIQVLPELPKENIAGKIYDKNQLADYDFLMKNFYSVHTSTTAGRDIMSAEKMMSADMKMHTENDKPQILIYHTHSQETYADFGNNNPDATVVGIGGYLTELMTAKGYNVIHDTSVYDLRGGKLDRNKAYTYALEGITEILQNNPSIEVVLDIHRDGVNEKLRLVTEVNGKQTAQIMFFNGMSRTPDGVIEYLQNPYLQDNLAFSFQMQMNAAMNYPGYTRKIYLKGLRYNLHLRPKSALIEVGAQTNTYEEAKNAMEPLSELLDRLLQGK